MKVSSRFQGSCSLRASLGVISMLALFATLAPAAIAAPATASYVVVLKDDVAHPAYLAHRHERNRGAEITHVYGVAIKGYSAELTSGQVKAVEKDPNVKYVESDGVIRPKGQAVGNQLKRVYANLSQLHIDGNDVPGDRVNADIAILDTGVYQHPDLNIVARVNCVGGGGGCKPGQFDDDAYGHGTHVAGDAAAIDNGIGAVGTAPGARIWSVKVIKRIGYVGTDEVGMSLGGVVSEEDGGTITNLEDGNNRMSDAIAGINYVTAHSSEIEVANMSFACVTDEWGCAHTALKEAIATSVNSGVVWVAAAGQEGMGVANNLYQIRHYPALLSDVITVSAMADYDGLPGSLSNADACPLEKGFQHDDRLMREGKDAGIEGGGLGSNYGPEVDMTAPGSCVFSTWSRLNPGGTNVYGIPGGSEYGFMYGSSVASALVAGAAADIAAQFNPNSRIDVEKIRAALLGAGNYNWEDLRPDGDGGSYVSPDGVKEPLLDLHAVPLPSLPSPVPPEAATEDSSGVNFQQVTLHGSVDPNNWNTRYLFQFGTTTSYGADSPELDAGGGDGFVPVSSTITGLGEGVTYHYRLVARNAAGYSYGKDRTFTTPASQDAGSWATRVSSTNPNAEIFTYVRGTTATGGHLLQTSWDGGNWQRKDLGGSVAAGTTPAVVRTRSTNPNAPIYVFYQGANGNLMETWWNGSAWLTENLGIAMAPNASPTAVRGPSTDPNAPIYLFYRDANGNLKETWWNGSLWSTEVRGVPMAAKTNPAVARSPSTNPNAPIYVFYRGADGNLKQTWWNEYVWSTEDRGVAVAAETSPSVTRAVTTTANAPIAVFYRTPTGKLAETWWNEYAWSTDPAVGGAEIAAGSSPAAVRTPSLNPNAPIHVFYRGAVTGKLTDTWWNESVWSTDVKGLAVAAGASPVVLRAPSISANAPIFTFYKGSGGFLTQTWWNEFVWPSNTFTTEMG